MPFAQSKRIMDDAIQGVRRFLTTHSVQYGRKVNFFMNSKKLSPIFTVTLTNFNSFSVLKVR